MHINRLWRGALFVLVAFAGGMVGAWLWQPGSPQAGLVQVGNGRIVSTFGVGGVVTQDGQLWQYRPDKKKWLTLDESFALEGQGTSVHPLPVGVDRVRMMETFGFLVTRDDVCWLYNIDEHRWDSIGTPP
jgi:hypothetical protein